MGNRQKSQQKGFTLIEILVVLVIISIVTALAVLTYGGLTRNRQIKIALEQFQAMVTLAQQRAILQPAVLGLAFLQHGYRFYQYTETANGTQAAWIPLPQDNLSNTSAFPKTTTISVKQLASETLPSRLSNKQSPHVLFFPNGGVTPFTLTLRAEKQTHRVTINHSGQGDITK